MTRLVRYYSEHGPGDHGGWWFRLARIVADKRGVRALACGLGADQQMPVRPWPVWFAEHRPNGSTIRGVVLCGFYVATQVLHRNGGTA